jgi:cytochrome c oxidase subunit 2
MERGEQAYASNCAVCHQATGAGMPPAFPALNGSAMVTQQPPEAQIKQVLHGKNAMPAFGASLNDLDVAAVVTYTKNAWDNQTGKTVQPSDIAALR